MRSALAAATAIAVLAVGLQPTDVDLLSHTCPTPIAQPFSGATGSDDPDAIQDPRKEGIDFTQVVPMCQREPLHPLCAGTPTYGHRHDLSAAQVEAADAALRRQFQYVDDSYQWVGHTTCGACADYALTLAKILAGRGQPGKDMYLQLMFIPAEGQWYAHATLWVRTSEGRTLEVDVGNPPQSLDATFGVRECYMPMDGSRTWTPLIGFQIDDNGCGPASGQ